MSARGLTEDQWRDARISGAACDTAGVGGSASALLRPAFQAAIRTWPDLSVAAAGANLVTLRRPRPAGQSEHSALLVVGRNRLDPGLFERCAIHNIHRFLEAAWSVVLADLGTACPEERPAGAPSPGEVVARAIAQTAGLRHVVMLTHSRYAINLSESGNDLVSAQPIPGPVAEYSVPIADLRLSESAAGDGWVDVFGCLCRHDAWWPRELAKALNWPVRTVYPGYSIYFPDGTPEPRSAIPFTRRLFPEPYAKHGWAVWLPGSDRPIRVSEPGETARRHHDRFRVLEGLLTRGVSVGLQPVRDFRKRRMFAAHARRKSDEAGGRALEGAVSAADSQPDASIGPVLVPQAGGLACRLAAAEPGSSIVVVGVVVAVRRLGAITFLLIRDSTSEIQVAVSGELRQKLKSRPPPFYATVSGILKRRPDKDVRSGLVNGSLEIEASDVEVQLQGGRPLGHPLDELFALTSFLHRRGFQDVNMLARLYAPAYCELMVAADAVRPALHLARLLGPSRWYLASPETLYVGLCPGTVEDLRQLLEPDAEADGPLGAMGERASFHEEHAGAPEEGRINLAYAEISLSGRAEPIREGRFWQDRHAIGHLDPALVATAVNAPKPDDAAVRALEEALQRAEALLQAMAGEGANMGAILRDLPEFDLAARHTRKILALFPSLEKRLAHASGEQQFELLWSILGHDHVKAVFSSPPSVEILIRCIEAGMFRDYNVLRALDPGTLESVGVLTKDHTDQQSIALIDQMFGASPAVAASACFLMRELDAAGLDWRRAASVAERGIVSRVAFAAAAMEAATADEVEGWRARLAVGLRHLFRNEPVDEIRCRSAFVEAAADFRWAEPALERFEGADPTFDLIQLTFGNGLVPYDESARMYERSSDCSAHWAAAGIRFGGDRWNAAEGRFDLAGFWLYPSKNRAAILAKSCSGICSARNFDLFHRKDHFQFTLVDPAQVACAGTVQMYAHEDAAGTPIWVVRGLNPSERVVIEPVGFTLELLDTLASLARHNGIDKLVCADGAGLFSADSSRLSVRAILRRLAASARTIPFREPLHIFDYHDRPISIGQGWQIWP